MGLNTDLRGAHGDGLQLQHTGHTSYLSCVFYLFQALGRLFLLRSRLASAMVNRTVWSRSLLRPMQVSDYPDMMYASCRIFRSRAPPPYGHLPHNLGNLHLDRCRQGACAESKGFRATVSIMESRAISMSFGLARKNDLRS